MFRFLPLLMVLLLSVSCATVKYKALEKMGYHKREILVDRVTKARDAQEEAKETFRDALDQFSQVLNFDGGDLADKYAELSKVLDRSEGKARDVTERIEKVEDVAGALFREWKRELGSYTNDALRERSEEQYNASLERYEEMLGAMKRAERKIDPVLRPLRDQVLFLKHNLNAQAINSLKEQLGIVEQDVASLIQELERAIAEADAYIGSMHS